MAKHVELGKLGEDIATEYLIRKGYQIKERNWHFNNAEIDIVAFDKGQLVIVEVKTRSAAIFEEARDAISDNKIRFLVNAAEAYILEKDIDCETRFDVIIIKWYGEGKYELEHIEEAFYPSVN